MQGRIAQEGLSNTEDRRRVLGMLDPTYHSEAMPWRGFVSGVKTAICEELIGGSVQRQPDGSWIIADPAWKAWLRRMDFSGGPNEAESRSDVA